MESTYKEGIAMPFILYDKDSQTFKFNPECENIIKHLNNEFGVVSIVGTEGSGKSFLLNKLLLQYKNGFSVGKGDKDSDNKGIWLWSKPLLGYDNEGKTMQIILLDTQGFGTDSKDFNDDSRIYTLAILISSLFIYNSMGNIDEKVINSLNFLCDLGKVVETEAAAESNEKQIFKNIQDSDIFPDLLWVLRDFSLQNLPESHEDCKLSPNDYLEKKLKSCPVKNSDLENSINNSAIEESNNSFIGSLSSTNKNHENVKRYFTKRECFTLISPLLHDQEAFSANINSSVNNNQKVDLHSVPDEKLRPEFLAQVLSLRKKVTNSCKKKTFNGIILNPENFLRIVNEYIQIFNSGKLPFMNSIWNNLCDWENRKAFEEAENTYIDVFKRHLTKKTLDNSELNSLHDQAKEKSLEVFKRKSIGDLSTAIRKSLKRKMEENLNHFANLNDEENKNEIFNFLNNQFNKIEGKLKNSELNTLEDINKEVDEIEGKINSNFPNTQAKREIMLDFKNKLVFFASNFIFKKLNLEINTQKEKAEEEKLQANSLKLNFEAQLKLKSENIEKLSLDNSKLKDQLESLGERSVLLDKDKEKTIQIFEEKISKIKEENSKLVSEFQEKIVNLEKKNLETELRSYEIRENYEKEKAALVIKLEYISKTVEEYARKEKNFDAEKQNQFLENTLINKTTLNNYENKIADLSNTVVELQDKILDSENNLHKTEHILEVNKAELDGLLLKYNNEKNELTEKNNLIKAQFDKYKSEALEEIEEKDCKLSNLESALRTKENEFFDKIKSTEESLKAQINKLERELVLEQQAKHFLQVKYDELVSNSNEFKDRYETYIANMQRKNIEENTESKEKNMELRNSIEIERKQIEENFERIKKNLIADIEGLNDKISEMENSFAIKKNELERTNKDLKESSEKLRAELSSALKYKIKLEEEKNIILEDSNYKYKKVLEDFEKRFEEKDKSNKKELESLNKNYEQTISHYKQLFEAEKNRLEEKIKEERVKYEKKTKMLHEEYESKIKDIEHENKNDLFHYKEEYEELDQNYNKYVIKTELEIKGLNEQIAGLEGNLKEARENFNNAQLQFNNNLEKKNEVFNTERKELLKKIDQLNKDLNFKEQEITSLKFKKENLEKENEEYENRYRKDKEMIDITLKKLKEENDDLRQRTQETQDECSIKKLEFLRENELLKQQIEFLNKKLEEHVKSKEEQDENIDDFIKRTRIQIQQEFINKIESLRKDKEDLATKLLNKKRELRDLEQAFLKQTCIHDKEKQSSNEKVILFESKKKEMMEYYNNAIELINQEALGMREDFEKEISEKDAKIESLVSKISELDRENLNFLSNKSNMKIKVGNLETQLEENKKFISDVQIKFDNILNNHISKSHSEKEKIKEEYEKRFSQIEQNYENLISEMREEYEKAMYHMRRENEDLEEELNSLSRQTQANMKASDPKVISEKITDLLATQRNLRKELDAVRLEKDKKIAEITSNFEREKELLNLKVLDLELAIREYEQLGFGKSAGLGINSSNSKNSFSTALNVNSGVFNNNNSNKNIIEFEKEKVKWHGERDSLKRNVGELNTKIDKLENKIESLLRENETLKLTYLEDHHSPIHHYRGNNVGNSNNSFIKKNSHSNSMIGAISNLENNLNNNLNSNSNVNNLLNKKNSFTLNMQMNMSSPIGKQEPNLFSDNSEIGEYNICYDITSPQVNISPEKKDYFNINNENKNFNKFVNGNVLGNNVSSSSKVKK